MYLIQFCKVDDCVMIVTGVAYESFRHLKRGTADGSLRSVARLLASRVFQSGSQSSVYIYTGCANFYFYFSNSFKKCCFML